MIATRSESSVYKKVIDEYVCSFKKKEYFVPCRFQVMSTRTKISYAGIKEEFILGANILRGGNHVAYR